MADDGNHRYRTTDPHTRGVAGPAGYPPAGPGQGGRAAPPNHDGGDPLAELARLIGQNDPYSDYGRDGARAPAPRRPSGPVQDWQAGALSDRDPYRAPADPRVGGNGSYPPHDPYRASADPRAGGNGAHPQYDRYHAGDEAHYPPDAPQFDERSYGGNGYPDPNYADPAYADAAAQAHQPGYDAYEQMPGGARGYEEGYYRDDPRMLPPGQEMYEDAAPARRRGGMMTVLAVLGLAVVGTAAAFGYRAVFGTSGKSATPPVIRADATPKKILPATDNRDPQTGKLIYDRVGAPGQGENVVAREEQPVDVKAAPRVVFPGPTANPSAGTMPSNASALASVAAGATGEPKRIRTVTIRSDQPTAANIPTARAAPASRAGAPAPAMAAAEPQPALHAARSSRAAGHRRAADSDRRSGAGDKRWAVVAHAAHGGAARSAGGARQHENPAHRRRAGCGRFGCRRQLHRAGLLAAQRGGRAKLVPRAASQVPEHPGRPPADHSPRRPR